MFLELFNNPGDARHTELTLTNWQENDHNPETGAVFQQEGHLKIVVAYKPHPAGVSGTGTVGSVLRYHQRDGFDTIKEIMG